MKAAAYKALYSLEGLSPKSLRVTCCRGKGFDYWCFCLLYYSKVIFVCFTMGMAFLKCVLHFIEQVEGLRVRTMYKWLGQRYRISRK